MNNLKTYLTVILAVCIGVATHAQAKKEKLNERFSTNKDVTLDVDTRYADVIIETWNKNEVSVAAYVEGDVSQGELQEAADSWDLDVNGNSRRVSVRTQRGYGARSIDLSGAEELSLPLGDIIGASISVVEPVMEGIVGPLLEGLTGHALPAEYYKELNKVKFDHEAYRREGKAYLKRYEKQVEESFGDDFDKAMDSWEKKHENNVNIDLGGALSGLKDIPRWPFGKTRSMNFDSDEYEKDKRAYINKLNRKYGTDVSIREVDAWLEDMEAWGDKFGEDMEAWGENFEINMKGFEKSMEAWGESFGKVMENWGENFGESMEDWGEAFGEKMEKWAEENADEWEKNETRDENGNVSKSYRFSYDSDKKTSSKVRRVIKIKVPKNVETDLNVRYGKLQLGSVYDAKASVEYGSLAAATIDGGNTSIDVAHSPVRIVNWNAGALTTNHVKECVINTAKDIVLTASSSDVIIKQLNGRGMISGSFGKLGIPNVGDTFGNLNLILENSDMVLQLPDVAFNFSYSGERNDLILPAKLDTQKMGSGNTNMVSGFHKSRNTPNMITISAKYSDVVLK